MGDTLLESVDILIVGGGIAGLSTALHLAKRGSEVMLLEREPIPGFYASGRNAGIGRRLTGRSDFTALAIEGLRRLEENALLKASGGLLLAADHPALDRYQIEAKTFGVSVEFGKGGKTESLKASEHLFIPQDGVIDIHGLLGHCIEGARKAGAELRFDCSLRSIHFAPDGFNVETDQGPVHAKRLVNAAGAWAGELARMAGGIELALKPLRRHLAWSDAPLDQDQPWAWWVDRPLYFRPESGGALICPCDEKQIAPPKRGQEPEVDPDVLKGLRSVLRECSPELINAPITRAWSGLRTFSPDRGIVIGWDPVNPNLFWVAGLGGHGMSGGLAIGELAARLIQEKADHSYSPRRFLL
jgi:D-arginine dehydrogenase